MSFYSNAYLSGLYPQRHWLFAASDAATRGNKYPNFQGVNLKIRSQIKGDNFFGKKIH